MSTGFKKLSGSILSIENRVFEHVLSHTYTFSFSLYSTLCIIKYYWCVLFFSLKDSTTRPNTTHYDPCSSSFLAENLFTSCCVVLLLLFPISTSHKRDRKVDGWKINDDEILIFVCFACFVSFILLAGILCFTDTSNWGIKKYNQTFMVSI